MIVFYRLLFPGIALAKTTVPKGGVLLPTFSAQAIPWVAGDPINGNNFTATGREILLVWNTHAANTVSFTVKSVPDPTFARLGDFTQAMSPLTYMVVDPIALAGWASAGFIYLLAATADIQFAVLYEPTLRT